MIDEFGADKKNENKDNKIFPERLSIIFNTQQNVFRDAKVNSVLLSVS